MPGDTVGYADRERGTSRQSWFATSITRTHLASNTIHKAIQVSFTTGGSPNTTEMRKNIQHSETRTHGGGWEREQAERIRGEQSHAASWDFRSNTHGFLTPRPVVACPPVALVTITTFIAGKPFVQASNSSFVLNIRAHGGNLKISYTKIFSWDLDAGDYDTNIDDGRR